MKKRNLIMMAVFAFLGSVMAKPVDGIIIHGDVISETGTPVKGSTVKITNVCTQEITTLDVPEKDGHFVFNGPYCNTYIVETSANGYQSQSQIVSVEAELVVDLKVKLAQKTSKSEEYKNKDIRSSEIAPRYN